MAYSSHRIILIALISMVSISPSLGRKKISKSWELENYLRDISSKTKESERSWKIIEPELSKFNDTDPRKIADTIIGLAKTKGEEIREQLNRLYEDSRDDSLVYKYGSCSKNYSDAIRNLFLARRDIELNTDQNIHIQIDDTFEELNSCELQFDNDSFDPDHIRDRNREFRAYMQIVKVGTGNLPKRS